VDHNMTFARVLSPDPVPNPRVFFNILGGSLTLLSLQLPWLTLNGFYPFGSGGLFLLALYWILAGAILSFLSRYAGIITIVGLFGFLGEPFMSFGYRAGPGLVLAAFGAFLVFFGVRWSIPSRVFRGREILGGLLYTIGILILLTSIISIYIYRSPELAVQGPLVIEMPLILVGAFLTFIGLRMYLLTAKSQGQEAVREIDLRLTRK